MFGLKLITQKNWDKELEKAEKKGSRNSFMTIEDLREDNHQLKIKVRNSNHQNEINLKSINYLSNQLKEKELQLKNQSLTLTKSMQNEAELRTAIREIIEKYKVKTPSISISNKELIEQLNGCFSELIQMNLAQIKLMNDVSETPDIANIRKIKEYLVTVFLSQKLSNKS
jgi:hypothetical protein